MANLTIKESFDRAIKLPYRDVINYCIENPKNTICGNQFFWKSKYEYDFGPISGLTEEVDWKVIYETRIKDISFFEISKQIYVLIDNNGQLFIGKGTQQLPRPITFNEKVVYITLNEECDIGVVTTNGNAYILLAIENYTKFHNVTPPSKRVLKIKLVKMFDGAEQAEVPLKIFYFLVLDDYSAEYASLADAGEFGPSDQNETKPIILSDPIKDMITFPRGDQTSIVMITWNNRRHKYHLGQDMDGAWYLHRGSITQMNHLPQQIFHHGLNYIVLSSGDIFIYNKKEFAEGSFQKIEMDDKVKWINQHGCFEYFYSILTEHDKLYLWKGPGYLDSDDQYINKEMLEINLQNGNHAGQSNEKYNIIASSMFDPVIILNTRHTKSQIKENNEINGLSLTADGKILTWSVKRIEDKQY